MRGHIEAFFAYPFKEIASFKSEKKRAVELTLMLVAYPLPDKGYIYPTRRGSGLFISLIGVWRCLLEDRQEIIPRFFRISIKRQIRNGGDTEQTMDKLLKYLMLMLVATLSITLSSCGGDEDEPDNPIPFEEYNVHTNSLSDGSKHPILGNTGYGDGIFVYFRSETMKIYVEPNAWSPSIAFWGKTTKLSNIDISNNLSWDLSASLIDGGGYIIEGVYQGRVYYIRLIVKYNTNAIGKVIGCTLIYQQFKR